MKRFSRCALILIIVTLLGAIGGYIFENMTTSSVYTSTAKVIVTPGEKNEASVRATDGGLVKDFEVVFASSTVITAAQKTAGTSEDIAGYLTVKTVPNSNIVELTVTNPDQSTAKTYVDAVAKNVSKTESILSVESIQVLEYGTEDNVAYKPDVLRNSLIIAGIVAALCLIVELIVVFVLNAFKDEDNSDDEAEYERRFGNMMAANYMLAMNHDGYQNSQYGADSDGDADEDERFDKAIGADRYREELSKLGDDEDGKKKKKNQKSESRDESYASNAADTDSYDEDDDKYISDEDLDDDYEDSFEDDLDNDDAGKAADRAVEAARAASAASVIFDDAPKSDSYDSASAETAKSTSASSETPVTSAPAPSAADYEAAATKEADDSDKKKSSDQSKESMRSSAQVLGIIKK